MEPELIQGATLRVRIASSFPEIRLLSDIPGTLLENCPTSLRPDFFLASVSEEWSPHVGVISQGGRAVGLIYGKERCFSGLETGIVYLDTTLGLLLPPDVPFRAEAMRLFAQALLVLPGIRAIRMVVPPRGPECIAAHDMNTSGEIDVAHAATKNHYLLTLPSTYEAFLQSMGSKTRKNFGYYRRRSEAAGHTFYPDLPVSVFRRAAYAMLEKNVTGASSEGLRRVSAMLASADRPLVAGLRSASGEWLALVAGWHEADRTIVISQLNDDGGHPQASLSVVLRGYLLEQFIKQQITKLVFWGGLSEPLNRIAEAIPAVSIHLDKRSLHWQCIRVGVRCLQRLIPNRFQHAAAWIALPYAATGNTDGAFLPSLPLN